MGLLQSVQPRGEGSAAQSMLFAGSQHISSGWKSITLPRLLPGLTQTTPTSTSTFWRRDHANLSSENKLRPSPSVTSTKPSSTTGCEGCSPRSRNHNSLRTCRFCSSSEGAARPNPLAALAGAGERLMGKEPPLLLLHPPAAAQGAGPMGPQAAACPQGNLPGSFPASPSPSVGLFTARGPGELSGSSTPPHPSWDRGSRSWGGSGPPLTWAEKSISFGSGSLFPSSLFRKSSKLPAEREGHSGDGSATACANPLDDTDPTGSQGAERDSRTQSGNTLDTPLHSWGLIGGPAPLRAPSCLAERSSSSAPIPVPPSSGLSPCPLPSVH